MASELVRFNETTKEFEISSKALNLLRSLNGPICVIAVCGRARQGKSFLLNQLLAKLGSPGPGPAGPSAHPAPSPSSSAATTAASGGFAVGSTVKPCTKGLWLWSKPVPWTLPNGQTCNLLLLDAEGIDSFDQTADYSNHIFSLALLLSSVLVYNQMGSIDESSVDKLASVCEFAKIIWGRTEAGASGRAAAAGGRIPGTAAGGSGGAAAAASPSSPPPSVSSSSSDDASFRDLSPSFVWLLRDFQLQLTQDGRKLSEREYMEEVLRELPGESEAVRAKNQLRASIKARFPDRECHALVRPLNDEARLARMESLHPSELRPEFRRGLDALVGLLLSRCRPRSLRGCALTGPALAALAEAHCAVINAGGLPTLGSTWQSVVQSECRRALDAATELYRSRMEAARGREVGLEALEALHSAALEAALGAFAKQAVGEPGEQEPFLRRLREAAAAAVAPLRLTKRAEADARALELLSAEGRRFAASVRGEAADLAAAEARLHDFLREYGKETGLGADRFMRAAEFLAGTVVPELRHLAQEARSRAATASRRVSELEGKLAEVTHGSTALRTSLDAASLAESRLGRELAASRVAADAAAAARAAATAAGREAAALRDQLAAARMELAARGEAADAGSARLRSELAAAQSRLAMVEAEAAAMAAGRAAEARQLAAREAELATRAAETEAARRAAEAARAAEAQARRHAESLSAQLSAREATLANLQRERDFLQTSLDQRHQQQQQQHTAAAAAAATGVAAAPAAAAAAPAMAERERRGRASVAAAPAAGPAAAASPGGRKRNRAAAELSSDEAGDVDVEMIDAGPSRFAGGAAERAAGADDGGDEEVTEVAAAAATTPAQRASRRQRRAVAPASGQRRQAAAAATPATAAAGGGDGGVNSGRTPFSVEREVLRTSTRGAAAAAQTTPAAATATTTPAATAAAGGEGGGASGRTPFSVEREILRTSTEGSPAAHQQQQQGRGTEAAATTTAAAAAAAPTRTPAAATLAAAAAAAAPRPPLPADLDSMKVDELKDWLTRHGWEEEVFARGRGRTTKREWADLVRAKCAQAAGGGAGGSQQQQQPSPAAGRTRGQARG